MTGGYYTVNNVIYENKAVAIFEAQKTKSDITWNYYNEIFSNLDWTIEPETDIDELYRIRAQNIRDHFDYVIVRVSGGADSSNIIWTFLNNDIKVDEIVADMPLSGLSNWEWNNKDISADNTISETKFAQIPLLNEIRNKFPNQKITVNDSFEDILKFKSEDWVWGKKSEWVAASVKGNLDHCSHIQNLAEQGKKIGVVWGIDKPQLRFTDSLIYTQISDRAVNIGADSPFDVIYPNVHRVLFYYTPELPTLMIKQCHLVAKSLQTNPHIASYIRRLSTVKKATTGTNEFGIPNPIYYPKSEYQRSICPIIYPSTYKDVFQCNKSDGSFMAEQHNWFFKLHGQTKVATMIREDFKDWYSKVDPKYLAANGHGFKIFTQVYKIGLISDFLKVDK
jgi:hypothetical protein